MAFDKPEWKPNPKQGLFLSLPNSIREAMLGGGAGTGKSDVLLLYALVRRWIENPRFKQVFMRRTFPELRNEIIPRSREIYNKFGASLNRSDMAWTFPRSGQAGSGKVNNGAMVFLGQCEDEKDVKKYDSMEINLFSPDEVTSLTEYIYLYIGFTRVRTSDLTLPAIIRCAGMPGGVGHTFFKKRFVDPFPAGGKVIIGKGGNKRFYVHTTLVDNPHIDQGYAQSLEGLNEAEKQAKKYGSWDAYQGQVFEEFRDKRYPDEPTNALHVIDDQEIQFTIQDWWPRLVIIDWGYRAMTWVGFAAIGPDKRVYVYRELYWLKTKIEEWAPFVKEFIEKESPRVVKICKSAGKETGQEHTIQQQVSSALGVNLVLTSNSPGSRVAGKSLLHEYLRWNPKPIVVATHISNFDEVKAQWIFRNRGPKEYDSYLKSFLPPEPETNLPKLLISNQCVKLIEAIKAAVYDKTNPEDVAEFEGDDPYDGVRYIIDAAEAYFDEAAEDFKKVQDREALVVKLKADEDMTAFYRNARRLDNQAGAIAVSRYHHRRR